MELFDWTMFPRCFRSSTNGRGTLSRIIWATHLLAVTWGLKIMHRVLDLAILVGLVLNFKLYLSAKFWLVLTMLRRRYHLHRLVLHVTLNYQKIKIAPWFYFHFPNNFYHIHEQGPIYLVNKSYKLIVITPPIFCSILRKLAISKFAFAKMMNFYLLHCFECLVKISYHNLYICMSGTYFIFTLIYLGTDIECSPRLENVNILRDRGTRHEKSHEQREPGSWT